MILRTYTDNTLIRNTFIIKILLLIECDNGTFGRGCGHKCGECFNSTQCNNIDGVCEFGCAPGFLGVTCKDGKKVVKL